RRVRLRRGRARRKRRRALSGELQNRRPCRAARRSARPRSGEKLVRRPVSIVIAIVAALVVSVQGQQTQQTQPAQQTPQTQQPVRPGGNDQGFRFKSGVELINVTATVSDVSGRFVSGLRAEDFLVYEDNQPVQVTHFSAERVPVSLGIALDTSGSMNGEKL